MIAITFTLLGLGLFMLSIAVMDGWIALKTLLSEVEKSFGHDTLIHQDYEQN